MPSAVPGEPTPLLPRASVVLPSLPLTARAYPRPPPQGRISRVPRASGASRNRALLEQASRTTARPGPELPAATVALWAPELLRARPRPDRNGHAIYARQWAPRCLLRSRAAAGTSIPIRPATGRSPHPRRRATRKNLPVQPPHLSLVPREGRQRASARMPETRARLARRKAAKRSASASPPAPGEPASAQVPETHAAPALHVSVVLHSLAASESSSGWAAASPRGGTLSESGSVPCGRRAGE